MTDPTVDALAAALGTYWERRYGYAHGSEDGRNQAGAAEIGSILADAGYVVVRADDDKRLDCPIDGRRGGTVSGNCGHSWALHRLRAALATKETP